ncbi:MAG: hypothetical protein HY926_13345 [Elusimicrobia bacterium]|nr:hypothetical protein [Elusimicrobiota bacterium]
MTDRFETTGNSDTGCCPGCGGPVEEIGIDQGICSRCGAELKAAGVDEQDLPPDAYFKRDIATKLQAGMPLDKAVESSYADMPSEVEPEPPPTRPAPTGQAALDGRFGPAGPRSLLHRLAWTRMTGPHRVLMMASIALVPVCLWFGLPDPLKGWLEARFSMPLAWAAFGVIIADVIALRTLPRRSEASFWAFMLLLAAFLVLAGSWRKMLDFSSWTLPLMIAIYIVCRFYSLGRELYRSASKGMMRRVRRKLAKIRQEEPES